MGKLVMLGAMALATAGAAGAQHGPGAGYPPPGPMGVGPMAHGPMGPGPGPMAPRAPQHWGSSVGGHWWGGVNAPGGWAGYRQPYRGYRVPSYWVSPRFYVTDWTYYGLPQPMGGYNWVRYYDDAVMIDRGGQVSDYRSGIDWDGRYDGGSYDRRSSGVGGAVAGAVVGGVAGNLIAGRGNRLGGTLIGAGVGAAGGYAIDRSRDRRGPPRGYYDGPRRGGYDGPPPPPPEYDGYYGAPGSSWVSPDGRTTVTTVTGGGYPVVSAPYGYASGGSVTTVTIQSAPVVTTTTTEVIEDSVTYTRPLARKVYRRRVYHARPRVRARCSCGS